MDARVKWIQEQAPSPEVGQESEEGGCGIPWRGWRNMSIFDTGIMDAVVKAIDVLGARQAEAIIEGFERAAHIIADKLEEIEKSKK